MKKQPIESQIGEIEFRKQMAEDELAGSAPTADKLGTEGCEQLLARRMQNTQADMVRLRDKGVVLSPYVEIGAERCQRSLVMENDISASGAAADISLDMLKSCDWHAAKFGKKRLPLRLCCDVYAMPILSNSLPFAFCYETLHHFPEPAPVVAEMHRILAPGGCFMFAEEPYKCVLHINLYKRRKGHHEQLHEPGKLRRLLDRHFASFETIEEEYGIIENLDIPLSFWHEALSPFTEKDAVLSSFKGVHAPLEWKKAPLKHLWAYLFGGGISGSCRKSGVLAEQHVPVHEVLACPSCVVEGNEVRLLDDGGFYVCSKCQKRYPIVDDVVVLLPYDRFETLYPELFKGITQ